MYLTRAAGCAGHNQIAQWPHRQTRAGSFGDNTCRTTCFGSSGFARLYKAATVRFLTVATPGPFMTDMLPICHIHLEGKRRVIGPPCFFTINRQVSPSGCLQGMRTATGPTELPPRQWQRTGCVLLSRPFLSNRRGGTGGSTGCGRQLNTQGGKACSGAASLKVETPLDGPGPPGSARLAAHTPFFKRISVVQHCHPLRAAALWRGPGPT